MDRDGTYLVEVVGRGQLKVGRVQRILTGALAPGAMLCSDAAYAYRRVAQILGVRHRRVTAWRRQRQTCKLVP